MRVGWERGLEAPRSRLQGPRWWNQEWREFPLLNQLWGLGGRRELFQQRLG